MVAMGQEKRILHSSFMVVSTLVVFWTARDTIPAWVVLPALAVLLGAPWLQRHKLTWEGIITVALVSVIATNQARLSIDYAARYREFFFLLVPLCFYAGIVWTNLKPPGEPVYLGNVVWLALLGTLDTTGAGVTIAVLSFLVLVAMILAGTEEDRPRFVQRAVSVGGIAVVSTVLAVSLPVETGPFSASVARGLQDFLFGRPGEATTPARHPTNWWKPWPTVASSRVGVWLMRLALLEEFKALGGALLLPAAALLAAWIFLGTMLQEGPGRSLRRLMPAAACWFGCIGVFAALVSMHSKVLGTLMLGPSSPWSVNGQLLTPRTWQMVLALRSEVIYAPSRAAVTLGIVARCLSGLSCLACLVTCIREAIAKRGTLFEGIGRRRERVVIERTIKRIQSLDDDELLRDPRGTVLALFYMAANALYPLDLAMVRGETPTELTARVAVWYPDLAEQIDILGRLFYIARYSTADIGASQVRTATAAYQKLLELLKHETQHPRIKTEGAVPIAHH